MAVDAVSCVIHTSPSTGIPRTAEIVMAEAVNQERLEHGHEALVWISHATLARRCNCSLSSAERALGKLKGLGRVLDTGQRMGGRYRGTVVYRLPHAEVYDPDHPQPDGTQDDYTQDGGGGADYPQTGADHPHPGTDHPQTEAPLPSPVTDKPVVEPGPKPEDQTDARPPAREGGADYPDRMTDAARVEAQRNSQATRDYVSGLSPSSTGSSRPTPAQVEAERAEKVAELAACDKLLGEGRGGSMTQAIADELRVELGMEAAA